MARSDRFYVRLLWDAAVALDDNGCAKNVRVVEVRFSTSRLAAHSKTWGKPKLLGAQLPATITAKEHLAEDY